MLPKNLKYGSKVESSQNTRSYIANIQPNGSTGGYTRGNVITINIPTRQNLCLCTAESMLKFTVKTVGVGNMRLDSAGAHGYIQRIRTFHGSNLIEDIDNYGMLCREMFDLQVPAATIANKYNILAGTRSDLILQNGYNLLNTLPNAFDLNSANLLINNIKGYLLNPAKQVFVMNNGELSLTGLERTYSLSLMSIMGTLSTSNYMPLFGATSAPIRIEIQLVDSVQKVGCTMGGITNFQFDNVEYIASYIELSDSAMNAVVSNLTNSLQFSLPSFRNYQYSYNLPANITTQVNFPIPAKYVSLKSLIISMRQVDKGVSSVGYFPFSSHSFNLQNYYFRVGSVTMPQIAPAKTSEFFAEVIKTVGSVSDLYNTPSIDVISYSMALPILNTETNISYGDINSGSFYIGIDMEKFQGSDKSTTYAGYNSTTDDIYCVMNFINNTAVDQNIRFDAFANFDQELCFSNDTCYVKF